MLRAEPLNIRTADTDTNTSTTFTFATSNMNSTLHGESVWT